MAEVVMTAADLSEYLNVPVLTLKRWRVVGKGPRWFRAGRHVRYRRSEADRWIAEQEREAAAGVR